jgi:hypothetical protein
MIAKIIAPYIHGTSVNTADITRLITQGPAGPLVPADKLNDARYLSSTSSKIRKILFNSPPAIRTPQAASLDGLRNFAAHFEASDQDNRLVINTVDSPLGPRYNGSIMVLGPIVRMAESPGSTRQFDCDGSHFKSSLPGFLKCIIYIDANQSVFPVLIAHDISEESSATWGNIINTFFQACPGAKTPHAGLASDRDGGLLSSIQPEQAESTPPPAWVHCVLHIENNILTYCRESTPMRLRLTYVKRFKSAAWASTVPIFQQKMAEIQRSNLPLYLYLSKIPAETWAISHFPSGRHLSNTTNSVESFWSAILEARKSNLLGQFYWLAYEWTMNHVVSCFHTASTWPKAITPHAQRHFENKIEELRGNRLQISISSPPPATSGTVVDLQEEDLRQVFSVNRETRSCTCHRRTTHVLPCRHLIAFDRISIGLTDPTSMFGNAYLRGPWLTGLEKAGGSEPPRLTSTPVQVLASLEHPNGFLPPVKYGGGKGRPKSRKRNRIRARRPSALQETWEDLLGSLQVLDDDFLQIEVACGDDDDDDENDDDDDDDGGGDIDIGDTSDDDCVDGGGVVDGGGGVDVDVGVDVGVNIGGEDGVGAGDDGVGGDSGDGGRPTTRKRLRTQTGRFKNARELCNETNEVKRRSPRLHPPIGHGRRFRLPAV